MPQTDLHKKPSKCGLTSTAMPMTRRKQAHEADSMLSTSMVWELCLVTHPTDVSVESFSYC